MTSPPLLEWFASAGVKLHPSLYLEQDVKTGLSFYSSQPLSKHTSVVRVPAGLCITPLIAFEAITQALRSSQKLSPQEECVTETVAASIKLDFESLPAPDWILLYLVICRIAVEYLEKDLSEQPTNYHLREELLHITYVQHLPQVIPTPLHFSASELELLQNTPLHGSTLRRLQETIVDYTRATSVLSPHLTGYSPFSQAVSDFLTPLSASNVEDDLWQHTHHPGLELWRWAESAFTSRAFPSRLIGLTFPTSDGSHSASNSSPFSQASPKDGSIPILIPAYDTFNHCRAMPVTWNHVPSASSSPSPDFSHISNAKGTGYVEMILNYEVQPFEQVWNNYGGKSNEEFLAGYGFTLDTDSEDTLALKLGSDATHHRSRQNTSPDRELRNRQATTHYWPMHFPAPIKDTDRYRSSRFIKSASPCPSLFREIEKKLDEHSEDEHIAARSGEAAEEEELNRYAHLLETLEQLLLSKRKAFKVSQARVDSLLRGHNALDADTTSTDQQTASRLINDDERLNPRQELNRPAWIRKSVYSNVQTYRNSQFKILNNAIAWTRAELERVAEAFDALDLAVDEEAR